MSNGNGSHPEWENGKAYGNGEDGKPARNSDENPTRCPMTDVMFGWPEIAMLADLLRCPLTVVTKSDILSICGHFRGATDWLLSHGMLRSRLTDNLEVNRPLLWRFGSALASSRTKPVSGNAVISELLAGKKQDDLRSVLKVIDQIPTDFAGAIFVTPPSPLEPEDMEYLARQFARQLQVHGLLSVSVCLIPAGVKVSTLSRVAMEQLLMSQAQGGNHAS